MNKIQIRKHHVLPRTWLVDVGPFSFAWQSWESARQCAARLIEHGSFVPEALVEQMNSPKTLLGYHEEI